MSKVGIIDTTFSRINMGEIALQALSEDGTHEVMRRTVPGIKDLPLAAKWMLERDGCDIAMACGMPGPEPIDTMCAHEASTGLIQASLMADRPIIEVFVHMSEADSDRQLRKLTRNRVREHISNLLSMLDKPERLIARAGTGERQGWADSGPIE